MSEPKPEPMTLDERIADFEKAIRALEQQLAANLGALELARQLKAEQDDAEISGE